MADDSGLRVRTVETSSVTRSLEVEVPKARVRKAFDGAYRDLAKKARVKGFRPGKAPRSVLEKLYGPSLAEDIERVLVAETLPEAIDQAELRPIAEPAIDATTPEIDADFQYTATIEVKPSIALPKLKGLPATRPTVEVSDDDVQAQLEELRVRNAPLVEEPEGTAAAVGHTLKLNFVGRIDGEPFEGGTGNDVDVEVGSERFIPGFEEQLVGAVAGESRDITVSFPEDYGSAELAGKQAVFEAQVLSVQRRDEPELDDEFAKDLGDFESLDELRTRIRDDMEAGRKRESDAELHRTLLDALVERTEFEVPQGLVDRRLQNMLQRAHQQFGQSMPHDQLHAQLDAWQSEWRPRAEREVREALLLEAVAADQELTASDEEIDARLEQQAEQQGIDVPRLRTMYEQEGLIEALRVQLQDEKALAFLAGTAKIEETSTS